MGLPDRRIKTIDVPAPQEPITIPDFEPSEAPQEEPVHVPEPEREPEKVPA